MGKSLIKNGEKIIYEKGGLISKRMRDIAFNNLNMLPFLAAEVSDEIAYDERRGGVFRGEDKRGCYMLSTDEPDSLNQIFYVTNEGRCCHGGASGFGTGLRVYCNLIFMPNCSLYKNCKNKTITAQVDVSKDNGDYYRESEVKEVTGTMPIVTMPNGKEYVWLNEEDCKSGFTNIARFWNEKVTEKAESGNKDYFQATKLREQAENYVDSDLTDEIRAMMVTMRRTSADSYETCTPVFDAGAHRRIIEAFDKFKYSCYSAQDMEVLDYEINTIRDGLFGPSGACDAEVTNAIFEEIVECKRRDVKAYAKENGLIPRTTEHEEKKSISQEQDEMGLGM